MKRLLMMMAATTLCLAGATSATVRLNGSMPDITRQHHQRVNCHGAYDVVVAKHRNGTRLTGAEEDFADAYEANARNGQPCPVPDEALAAQAINRDVVSQEAFSHLIEYVQNGDPAAHYELGHAALLGRVPNANAELGLMTMQEAANLGDGPANFLIGMGYHNGQLGGRADPAAAFRYVQAAANTGHVDALFFMGLYHGAGQGTRENPAKALEYLRRAAEHGHIYATFMAANMVNTGQGVKPDYDLAYRLGRNLVDRGEVVGAVIAASALLQRRDVRKHENEVLYWMDLAIQHGDTKIRADMNRMRPQVAQIYQKMKAPPAFKPRERKLCQLKRICDVDRHTRAQISCRTYVDYWSDCNTDPRF